MYRCSVKGVEIVETGLGYLDDDRILDPCLRVHPKVGRYLAAARKRQKHIVYDIFGSERKILRFPTVYVDINLWRIDLLLYKDVNGAGNVCYSFFNSKAIFSLAAAFLPCTCTSMGAGWPKFRV